jgi:hypothetical protein
MAHTPNSSEVSQTTLELKPQTIEELSAVLRENGIPVEQWGIGKAKTLTHLLGEVEEGESKLIATPNTGITRHISAVDVDVFFIKNDEEIYRLKEDRQEFADGRVRKRELEASLLEKMKPDEYTLEAATRALREEIGVANAPLEPTHQKREVLESPSYPGLSTVYEVSFYAAYISVEDFDPKGYREIQDDKTSYFVWERIM